jgi:hypothetical protein
MDRVINTIQKTGGITLTPDEKRILAKKISSIDFSTLANYNKEKVFNATIQLMLGEVLKRRKSIDNREPTINKPLEMTLVKEQSNNSQSTQRDTQQVKKSKNPLDVEYDMHLYLNNQLTDPSMDEKSTSNLVISNNSDRAQSTELAIASLLGLNDAFSIQQLFNPEATYIRNYVVLDSKYRILNEASPDSINLFTWSYVDNANIDIGTVNSIGTIKNVMAMRIYQPRVPFVSSGTYSMNTESRRVAIVVQEFIAQSFIGPLGSKFHFMLQPIIPVVIAPTTLPNMIELEVEEFNDGIFRFRKPIVTFNTLSVSFLDPVNVIPFNHDRDTITFTYGNPTIITTSTPHLFVSTSGNTYGNITGFTTAAPSTDAAIIAAINNPIELTLTVTGANTFTIPINTTAITPSVGLVANIFFNERRVILPMEFTYLRNEK